MGILSWLTSDKKKGRQPDPNERCATFRGLPRSHLSPAAF